MIRSGKIGDPVFVHAWLSGPVKAEITKRQKKSGLIWYTIKLTEAPNKNYDSGYEMTVRALWLTNRIRIK